MVAAGHSHLLRFGSGCYHTDTCIVRAVAACGWPRTLVGTPMNAATLHLGSKSLQAKAINFCGGSGTVRCPSFPLTSFYILLSFSDICVICE